MAAVRFLASHVIVDRSALCGARGDLPLLEAQAPAEATCRRCRRAAPELGAIIGRHTVLFFLLAQELEASASRHQARPTSMLLGRWQLAGGCVLTVRGFDRDLALVRDQDGQATTITIRELEAAIDAPGSRYLGR